MRGRTADYVSTIFAAAKAENLDDNAAYGVAFAFLKAYRPRETAAWMLFRSRESQRY
jgi:hypothetical protein